MTAPYPSSATETRDAAPPESSYVSPIPMRETHLGDAIVAEWTKIRSIRSTMWTLGTLVVLVVGTSVAVSWATASTTPVAYRDYNQVLAYGSLGVIMGTICVITLGVLTFSSEFGTGLIRTTLTACPSRARVLAAKSVVYFAVILVLMLVLTLVSSVLQVVILDAPSPPFGEWVSATLGVSIYMALLGVLSQALGAMVKHATGAITVMLGVVMLPLILWVFLTSTLPKASDALLRYSIPSQLGSLYPYLDSIISNNGPTAWASLWILIGVTALALVGAYAALERRDA